MEAPSSKRPAEDEIVQVFGFSRSWSFAHGITAGEVIDFAAHKYKRRSNDIAIQDRTSSAQPILGRQTVLALGRKYFFTDVSKPDTDAQRTFAVGCHADPRKNYFVPPDVTQLVDKLGKGKFCVLCGARQSGKTTMAMAVKEQLSMDAETCVVYLDKVTIHEGWEKSRFWGALWDHVHGKCSYLFPPRPSGVECTDWSFRSLFLVQNLPLKVTLLVDEADAFLNASSACLDDFFSTLKSMKEDPLGYNLNGVLLIGVESIKDLLDNRRRRTAASATPSPFSPFTHSFLTQPLRFGVEDVEKLLRQAEAERPGVTIQVDRIARSVMDWTGGHKGLVGLCLDQLVNKELWSYRQWIEEAESFRLATYVFQLQTYSKILNACRAHVDVLQSFLQVEALLCDDVRLVELRDLLAEGVLFAKEAVPEGYEVSISSPLLRAVILRRCVVTSETVDPPPQPYQVDPLWTVLEAIKSLDMGTMCRPECLKATGEIGEYSYHFALFARLKAVLRQAYPLVDAKVLCECKQAVEYLVKRTKEERIDIVVRNNENFSKFGCELVVNSDVKGHVKTAMRYAKEHSAQVYVINFTMQDVPEIITPEHASVVFISVHINPSGNETTARVTIAEAGEAEPVELDLQLRKWDGKISFDRV